MDWLAITGSVAPVGALVGVLVLLTTAIARGQLFTKREMDAAQRRIDSLEAQNTDLRDQNTLLLKEGLMTQNAIIEAVTKAVGEQRDHG